MFSDAALKIYAAKRAGIIKTNAQFWREYNNPEKIAGLDARTEPYAEELRESRINLVCAFDSCFPAVPERLSPGEKPCLFAYRGDISLLGDRTKNVSVVGTVKPNGGIIESEEEIVGRLAARNYNIVSGLAVGCDTAAHKSCLSQKGKTVAFLPSTLNKIYPKCNEALAWEIVESGGLVITEYIAEATGRYQSVARFIERDRLQAMFAGSIILIASCLPGKGDSGSRHAMKKAEAYGTKRYVMYNQATDGESPVFGLNRLLAESGAVVLTPVELDRL